MTQAGRWALAAAAGAAAATAVVSLSLPSAAAWLGAVSESLSLRLAWRVLPASLSHCMLGHCTCDIGTIAIEIAILYQKKIHFYSFAIPGNLYNMCKYETIFLCVLYVLLLHLLCIFFYCTQYCYIYCKFYCLQYCFFVLLCKLASNIVNNTDQVLYILYILQWVIINCYNCTESNIIAQFQVHRDNQNNTTSNDNISGLNES